MKNSEVLLVAIPEAARMLGIGRSSVYRLLSQGKLAAVKMNQRRLVVVASIRALVEAGGDDVAA